MEVKMSDQLNNGAYVFSGERRFRVLKEIGGGGQGNVYLVSEEAEQYALKWYNKTSSTAEQYAAIEILVEKGAPSEKFIWPLAIVEGESKDNFGYVMPLIDTKRFTKLAHYFGGEIKVKRFEPIIDACIRMAHGFNELHLSGLCYRDISFGNLFVDFETGEVLICDNDNVTFDNLTKTEDIWGTHGFMAPEVVKGEKPPSSQTDLFSLAVVLFRMLHLQHPLQGKRDYEIEIADLEALTDLYGHNPVFIYDPIDETNRPVKGKKDMADAYWPYYPEFLKNKFIDAFTHGLQDPNQRIRESIWIKTLAELRASLMYCYSCGEQVFYDQTKLGHLDPCPKCGKAIDTLPPRLKIGEKILMLNHDVTLYTNQIDDSNPMDYETPYAKVEIHPRHPEIWGLKNLSEFVWRFETKDGEMKEIYKEGVIPIKDNQEIFLDKVIGTMRIGTKITLKKK
jgi:serine/threonine protein kinase